MDYAWSELYLYKLNCGVKRNKSQLYNSARAISYYRMSKLLGLEHLIPNTKFIRFSIDKGVKFGLYMDSASGIPFLDIMNKDRSSLFTSILQRDLVDLNLLDVICFEKDHRPDNYNVLLNDDAKVYSVSVFDNDSPMSFYVSDNICFETYDGCSEFVKKDGILNRPFINRVTYENMLRLNEKTIRDTFSDLLTKPQVKSLIARFFKLRDAITKGVQKKECVLLNANEWNETTVNEEITGRFGITYLGIFASDWINSTI